MVRAYAKIPCLSNAVRLWLLPLSSTLREVTGSGGRTERNTSRLPREMQSSLPCDPSRVCPRTEEHCFRFGCHYKPHVQRNSFLLLFFKKFLIFIFYLSFLCWYSGTDYHVEVDRESYRDQCELFSMMELIWHLCEVLYLEILPVGCLIQQLLEWVRWHSASYGQLQQEIISAPRPEEHESFWQLVYKLVLQGNIREARDVLGLHSFAHTSPKVPVVLVVVMLIMLGTVVATWHMFAVAM